MIEDEDQTAKDIHDLETEKLRLYLGQKLGIPADQVTIDDILRFAIEVEDEMRKTVLYGEGRDPLDIDYNEVAMLPHDPEMPGFTPPKMQSFVDFNQELYKLEETLSMTIRQQDRHSSSEPYRWFGPSEEPNPPGKDCKCSGCVARFYNDE